MNRQSLLLGIVVVAGCLVIALLWNDPSRGQVPLAPPASKIGKYQVAVAQSQYISNTISRAILCDTETGQMWVMDVHGQGGFSGDWKELKSPIQHKPK